MIPVRTVMPSRTFPAVTVALIAAHTAAFLFAGAGTDTPRWSWSETLVHDDGVRLGADAVCLWLFGDNVEDRMGRSRFAVFYLLCGLAAAASALATGSAVEGIAASGAVGGAIGAHLALFPQSRVFLLAPAPPTWTIEAPALVLAAFWTALHLALGALPADPVTAVRTAAISGLAAGMVAGAISIRAFTRRERMRPEWWHDR
jgi:membrane associated rhomboid family serine protease